MHISESRRRRAVARPHRLHRLPLAAIRRAPQRPVLRIADGIAGIPELCSDPAIAGVFQHADFLATFNFPPVPVEKLNWDRRSSMDHERLVSIKIPSSVL